MDEGTIGLIALVLINVIISLILHSFHKEKIKASAISGLSSIVIFLIIAHIISGPEKFIIIAFFVGGFISMLISFTVGELFYFVKRIISRRRSRSGRS